MKTRTVIETVAKSGTCPEGCLIQMEGISRRVISKELKQELTIFSFSAKNGNDLPSVLLKP